MAGGEIGVTSTSSCLICKVNKTLLIRMTAVPVFVWAITRNKG